MSESALTISDFTFSYRDTPLFEHLSLTFPKGKFVSIIGPNGSGKTTLIRALIGSLKGKTGELTYEGKPTRHMTRREQARHISFVPQSGRIDWDLSVYECVAMGRYAHHRRFSQLKDTDTDTIERAVHALGLSELKERLITELSGGEYQRMLIARALAQDASVIALDEPVSHLDIHHQVEILSLLRELTVSRGVTVITVLHDLNAAAVFSDRVILLNNGSLAAEGTAEEVLTEERIEQVYSVNVDIVENMSEVGQERYILPRWKQEL